MYEYLTGRKFVRHRSVHVFPEMNLSEPGRIKSISCVASRILTFCETTILLYIEIEHGPIPDINIPEEIVRTVYKISETK